MAAEAGSLIKLTQSNTNYLTESLRPSVVHLYLVDQLHGGINVFKSSRDGFFSPIKING